MLRRSIVMEYLSELRFSFAIGRHFRSLGTPTPTLCSGGETRAEPSSSPREWNGEYFALLAISLEDDLPADQVDHLTIEFFRKFPDQPFYDAITKFVRSLDVVYFGRGEIKAHAARIRSGLAAHLMETGGWKRLGYRRSKPSIEMH